MTTGSQVNLEKSSQKGTGNITNVTEQAVERGEKVEILNEKKQIKFNFSLLKQSTFAGFFGTRPQPLNIFSSQRAFFTDPVKSNHLKNFNQQQNQIDHHHKLMEPN